MNLEYFHKKFLYYNVNGNKIDKLKKKYNIVELNNRNVDFLNKKNIEGGKTILKPAKKSYADKFNVIYIKLKTMTLYELQTIKDFMNKVRIPRAVVDYLGLKVRWIL